MGAPYDLGATAAPITSSRQMAETVRRFLGHLRAQRPAMAPTSQIDLVVCTTGQDIEDASVTPPRTTAECLLHHLIAHDDTVAEEARLFSRPLVVTAPRGYLV